ncbi:MAG: gfo/Idh/MocA family oxidoreductase, partial [Planctomycetes bacterium]|nr:gfo/Idh/MocA family oxidoreductase [Planctomycetota bacterium]
TEADPAHTARIQGILAASSAITHEGSHVLDYAAGWMRSPLVRASAEAVRTDPRLRGPNLWDARLSTADGSLLCVRIGWMLPSMPPSSLRLSGPGGSLTCDLGSGAATLRLGTGHEEIDLGRPTQEWAAQLDVFAEAIDRGRAEIATVDDGMRALAASEACERSARTLTPVAIPQPALRAATA